MALSFNANFIAAMRRGVIEPRVLVTLHVSTSVSYKFLSGKCAQFDYPKNLASVSPVSRELDVLTRKVSVDQVSVVLVRDARLNSVLENYGLVGSRLVISYGEASLVENDFETIDTLIVDGVSISETKVTLKAKAPESKLIDREIFWQFVDQHPLQVILKLIQLSGAPSSMIDTSTFAVSANTEIGHFNLVRAHLGGIVGGRITAVNGPKGPESTIKMIDELTRLLNGAVTSREDGKIAYIPFDTSSSSAADLDEDDISDLVIHPLYETILNRITVNTHPWETEEGAYTHEYHEDDTDSQATFGIVNPGGSLDDNIKELVIETPWISAVGRLVNSMTNVSPGVGDTFLVSGWSCHAMSGARWGGVNHSASKHYTYSNYDTGSQDSNAELTDSRTAYLDINHEIIEVDRCTVYKVESGYGQLNNIAHPDIGTEYTSSIKTAKRLLFRVKARGALGSTAVAHTGFSDNAASHALVFDSTIQQRLAGSLIDRFSNGAQKLEFSVNMSRLNLQVGDFITLTLPSTRYISKGKSGLTTATKFEITGKQVDIFASPPRIRLTVVYATETSPPSVTRVRDAKAMPGNAFSPPARAADNSDVGEGHVVTGLDTKSTAGFVITLNKGILSSVHTRYDVEVEHSVTVPASKDTYITGDPTDGVIGVYSTTLGAGTPSNIDPSEILLVKVVSDGSGITGTTDLRPTEALDGAKLVLKSVDTEQLALGGVIPSRLSGSSRSQHGVFGEYFDELPSAWTVYTGSGTLALVSTGQAGGRAIKSTGQTWRYYNEIVPYDPSKLYRIRCRVRMTQRDSGADGSKERVYCGLVGVAANGTTLVNKTGANSAGSQHYLCAENRWVYDEVGLNTWVEYTGWVKGTGSPGSGESTDPTSPGVMHTNVRYVKPVFILNYDAGDGIMELDYISIDVMDEDAINRAYVGLTNTGLVQANKVVAGSIASGGVSASTQLASSVVNAGNINTDMELSGAGNIVWNGGFHTWPI